MTDPELEIESGPQAEWSNLEELQQRIQQVFAANSQEMNSGSRMPSISLESVVDLQPHFLGDPKGATITFRIPEDLRRVVDVLIHQDGIPHQTLTDVARDALFHYTETLIGMLQLRHPLIQMTIMRERMHSDATFLAQEQQKVAETIEAVHNYLVGLLDQGAYTEAQRALDQYWELADTQQGYWRATYVRAIRSLASVQVWLEILEAAGLQSPWHHVKLETTHGNTTKEAHHEADGATDPSDSGAESGVHDSPV